MANPMNKDDIVQAQMRKIDIEEYHLRILKELHPKGTDNPHPKKNKYKPKDVISMRDWDVHRRRYRLLFAPLHIKIDVIEKYLNDFYRNWKDGVYPTSEKFLETLDDIFIEFANMLKTKNQKFYTDIQTFDELLEKFHSITNKMTYDGEGKSIGQTILREQATEVQEQIERYLNKRAEHGLELIDEMIAFKGLETKLKELHFETVIKPQLPKPPKPEDIAKTKEKYSVRYKTPTDGEQVAMVKKIKSQSKKIKALKIFGKMPDKDTMVKIIDECRFKTTDVCNDSAVGRKVGKDSETAHRWIEKLGLSYYAYNPKHLK